jgi:hypothetical protein
LQDAIPAPHGRAVRTVGVLPQSIDAPWYCGRRVRYRGAANRWMGFFDNMRDRPIARADWRYFQIDGY